MDMHQKFHAAKDDALHLHRLAFESATQITDPAARAQAATQAGTDFANRMDDAWLEFLRESDREYS